ncbi:MAG: transglutaminase-like cysteine peptidase [Gammaproteobacteria bacterium]|nr:transglutaminase-like cysteine peptidase [Gammaproteobacteria bacterium]
MRKLYCGKKALLGSTVGLFLLFVPGLHLAQTFADDEMLNRLKNEYSEQARQRGIALNALLNRLHNKSSSQQLTEVNDFFNQFRYREDISQWGVEDYWATPEEFIGVYTGDCEDFVISKYFALRALGVADEKLYLTYVKAVKENIAHMVLSYFETPKSIPLILDNYNPRIVTADKRKDLFPVYSFNARSLFLTDSSAGLGKSLPSNKIKNSKWEKLLANIKRAAP